MVDIAALDIEKQKKIESSPLPPATQDPSGAPAQQPPAAEAPPAPTPPGKTFANRAFNIVNYFGIGWIVNSSLSLLIAYNILPTDEVQTGIKKSASIMKPIMAGFDKVKGLFGMSKLNGLPAAEQERHIMESARSATEICCMFVAGCMVLPFMKWAEDHKQGIVDWIDRKWNRKYYQQCDKYKQECEAKGITPEAQPAAPEGNKQTWGKLLSARALGMGIVLGGDAVVQGWNNKHTTLNTDLGGWKAGSWLDKVLPNSVRNRIIKTFSTKGITVEGIQPQMRERLLDYIHTGAGVKAQAAEITEFKNIIDDLAALNDRVAKSPRLETAGFFQRRGILKELNEAVKPERDALINKINGNPKFREITEKAIFSEQARLVSKEVGWTLVMAGLIFAFSKTGALTWGLKKLGLKKDGKDTNAEFLLQDAPLLPFSDGDENMIKLEAKNGSAEKKGTAVASNGHSKPVITPAPASSSPSLDSYKTKKVLPSENHTDLAKAGEPNLQLGA